MPGLREYNTPGRNKRKSDSFRLSTSSGALPVPEKTVWENPTRNLKRFTVAFVVLIALAVCGGEEKAPEEKQVVYCKTEHALSSKKLAEQMISDGLLIYVNTGTASHTFFIDPIAWHILKYTQKHSLIIALEVYSDCRFQNRRVIYIKDAYSGKRLGKTTGAGGSKIYK